jgi:hypothetical protein
MCTLKQNVIKHNYIYMVTSTQSLYSQTWPPISKHKLVAFSCNKNVDIKISVHGTFLE